MESSVPSNEDDNFDDITLTYEELLKVTKSTLGELLKNDPIVHDLPPDVTIEEIEALTAVLHGQSMTVTVKRGENDDVPVIVKRENSTVSDLKRAFRRAMTLKLRRNGELCKISWKHIWRVHWLSCDGSVLDNDHGLLKDFGVVNKSTVVFVPKLKKNKTR